MTACHQHQLTSHDFAPGTRNFAADSSRRDVLQVEYEPTCHGGEIGKLSRLKICRPTGLAGSSPARGTK